MATPIEQLQAMRRLVENWDGYNAAAPSATAIDLAQEFVGLIETMWKKSTPNSCLLHVSPTRIGGVLIEWEDRAIQHEIEISPDRSINFLHLDKTTGQIETRKFSAHRLLAVQPLEMQEEDSLIGGLLQTNLKFQALIAKSKASPRKPFCG
jgi:hypothetical protein